MKRSRRVSFFLAAYSRLEKLFCMLNWAVEHANNWLRTRALPKRLLVDK
jgi:hypothetical protein